METCIIRRVIIVVYICVMCYSSGVHVCYKVCVLLWFTHVL